MKKTVYSLVSVMLFFFVSCGGGGSNDPVQDPSGSDPVPNPSGNSHGVTSIEMSQTNAALYVGQYMRLTANFLSIGEASMPNYSWKTSDANVVEVKAIDLSGSRSGETVSRKIMGEIIGRSAGTAIVTIQTENGLSATCQVTVSNLNIEKITFDKPKIEIFEGKSERLMITVSPDHTTDMINKALKWSSENTDVVIISDISDISSSSEQVVVTGVKQGTTNIVVTSSDGTFVAKCPVTVKRINNVNYNSYGNDNQW